MYASPLFTHPPPERFPPLAIEEQLAHAVAPVIELLFADRAFMVIVWPPLFVHEIVFHETSATLSAADVKVPDAAYNDAA
jgi:hypothetical protein